MSELRYWFWKNGGPRERLEREIAWRLPRNIVLWAAIRLLTAANKGNHPDSVTPSEAVKAWLEAWSRA